MLFFLRAGIVAALTLNTLQPASSEDSVRLARLAATSGYAYSWLGTEGGVLLTRPGVKILLHAGYPVYDVNDAPLQADRSPQLVNGDLVVSTALARRLRRIALAYHVPTPIRDRESAGYPTATSGALTIHAHQIPGREALALSGEAPADVPVTITVTGEMSVDLPAVLISRITVRSANDGTYSAVAIFDQDSHRKTAIAIHATSLAGITPAVARFTIVSPNPNISSSLDAFPPK